MSLQTALLTAVGCSNLRFCVRTSMFKHDLQSEKHATHIAKKYTIVLRYRVVSTETRYVECSLWSNP